MALTNIRVVYGKCTNCGANSCIRSSYPSTAYSIPTLERITRKTCSQCKHELQIKKIEAKAGERCTL